MTTTTQIKADNFTAPYEASLNVLETLQAITSMVTVQSGVGGQHYDAYLSGTGEVLAFNLEGLDVVYFLDGYFTADSEVGRAMIQDLTPIFNSSFCYANEEPFQMCEGRYIVAKEQDEHPWVLYAACGEEIDRWATSEDLIYSMVENIFGH